MMVIDKLIIHFSAHGHGGEYLLHFARPSLATTGRFNETLQNIRFQTDASIGQFI